MNSFRSGPSWSLTPDPPARTERKPFTLVNNNGFIIIQRHSYRKNKGYIDSLPRKFNKDNKLLLFKLPVKVLAELDKLTSTISSKLEDEQTAYLL